MVDHRRLLLAPFHLRRELTGQPVTTCLLAVVPRAFIKPAACIEVVLHKPAVLEVALDKETPGERRSSKDAVAEFDFNELGDVEKSPIPGRIADPAADQRAFECIALHVEVGEGAISEDVVLPTSWKVGPVGEIRAFVKRSHCSMVGPAGCLKAALRRRPLLAGSVSPGRMLSAAGRDSPQQTGRQHCEYSLDLTLPAMNSRSRRAASGRSLNEAWKSVSCRRKSNHFYGEKSPMPGNARVFKWAHTHESHMEAYGQSSEAEQSTPIARRSIDVGSESPPPRITNYGDRN
jgi:hypothetical protein